MHHHTDVAWLDKECLQAESLMELLPIALRELEKFHNGAEIVCGPITTGGRGSIELNLKTFEATIRALQGVGQPIFSQIPYEKPIFRIRKRWQDEDPSRAGQYYMPILDEFYGPLIRSGRIRTGWFIPGYESSRGACWEREELIKANIVTKDLKEEWINSILRAA